MRSARSPRSTPSIRTTLVGRRGKLVAHQLHVLPHHALGARVTQQVSGVVRAHHHGAVPVAEGAAQARQRGVQIEDRADRGAAGLIENEIYLTPIGLFGLWESRCFVAG